MCLKPSPTAQKITSPRTCVQIDINQRRTETWNSLSAFEGMGETMHKICVQRMIVVEFSVTLEKIEDTAIVDAMDEIISILHERSLNLDVFMDKVNIHQNCLRITQDMVER